MGWILVLLQPTNTTALLTVRMAATAAIERAQNEHARFVERELALQKVNLHSFLCFIQLFLCVVTGNQLPPHAKSVFVTP